MKKTILAVDDELSILHSLQRSLKENFYIKIAESGEQALEVLRTIPVDMVLTDERMPGMSGSELLKEMRKEGIQIPCVILTGYDPTVDATRALEQQSVFAIVKKPWDTPALVETLSCAGWSTQAH